MADFGLSPHELNFSHTTRQTAREARRKKLTAPLVELSFWYSPPATQGSGQPERRTARIGRAPKCGSGRRTALCERHSADADDGAPVRDRAQREAP